MPPESQRTDASAMDTASLTAIPGRRIGHYRNSARRFITLYGLGKAGASVAQAVAERGLPNVAVRTGTGAAGWGEIAGAKADAQTNMVVIVCGEGDEALFRPEPER